MICSMFALFTRKRKSRKKVLHVYRVIFLWVVSDEYTPLSMQSSVWFDLDWFNSRRAVKCIFVPNGNSTEQLQLKVIFHFHSRTITMAEQNRTEQPHTDDANIVHRNSLKGDRHENKMRKPNQNTNDLFQANKWCENARNEWIISQ